MNEFLSKLWLLHRSWKVLKVSFNILNPLVEFLLRLLILFPFLIILFLVILALFYHLLVFPLQFHIFLLYFLSLPFAFLKPLPQLVLYRMCECLGWLFEQLLIIFPICKIWVVVAEVGWYTIIVTFVMELLHPKQFVFWDILNHLFLLVF